MPGPISLPPSRRTLTQSCVRQGTMLIRVWQALYKKHFNQNSEIPLEEEITPKTKQKLFILLPHLISDLKVILPKLSNLDAKDALDEKSAKEITQHADSMAFFCTKHGGFKGFLLAMMLYKIIEYFEVFDNEYYIQAFENTKHFKQGIKDVLQTVIISDETICSIKKFNELAEKLEKLEKLNQVKLPPVKSSSDCKTPPVNSYSSLLRTRPGTRHSTWPSSPYTTTTQQPVSLLFLPPARRKKPGASFLKPLQHSLSSPALRR